MKKSLYAVLIVFCSVMGPGAAADSAEPEPLPPALALAPAAPVARVMHYRIGPADVLHISVWKDEALSRTVTVRPDGYISLPLVNDIRASGRTPAQLREELIKRLGEFTEQPASKVSVIVDSVHSITASVLGEVLKPGRFEFRSLPTVLDALAEAGGFTQFAATDDITILRMQEFGTQRVAFDYDAAVEGRLGENQILIQPGDIIIVP